MPEEQPRPAGPGFDKIENFNFLLSRTDPAAKGRQYSFDGDTGLVPFANVNIDYDQTEGMGGLSVSSYDSIDDDRASLDLRGYPYHGMFVIDLFYTFCFCFCPCFGIVCVARGCISCAIAGLDGSCQARLGALLGRHFQSWSCKSCLILNSILRIPLGYLAWSFLPRTGRLWVREHWSNGLNGRSGSFPLTVNLPT
jgi:hypothetical protein